MKRSVLLAVLCTALCLAASESQAVQIATPGLWVDIPIVIGAGPRNDPPPVADPGPPPPPPPAYWGPPPPPPGGPYPGYGPGWDPGPGHP
ncbi:MAG: hypothetical protein GYA47_08020 [Desulfovibrio sp.]|nr:hypothetical protein [Desulfovibrio sp.]